ncbi:MAG: L-threonylcarbamoyladenylate synthase [Chloroflexota bacterium]
MGYSAETYMAKIDGDDPSPLSMALASQVIIEGGLVAFPTETVYGLGANALNAEAVERIFKAKERPANDPIIVHVDDLDKLRLVARDIPDIAYTLAEKLWAGALTMVLKRSDLVPDIVTAGQDTVAVRMPAHPVALALIRQCGVPIAAPSANRFSRPSPTSAVHVMHDLFGRVDVVLDGGNTDIGVESSIVDLTGSVPTLLRPGGISLEELRRYIPSLAFRPRHILDDELAPAPGTLKKHYSPNADVLVFAGADNTPVDAVWQAMRKKAQSLLDAGKKVGIMVLDADVLQFEGITAQYVLLGQSDNAMAANLFSGMRELDAAELDVIMVQMPEQTGIGLAIRDRLRRAAEGDIISVPAPD